MRARLGAIGFGIMLAGTASANGAMGLGLEMFDLRYWYAYVVAMVVLEAWLIGRWAKASWLVALGVSCIANLITGVACGGLGCLAPLLHGVLVGSPVDPNPLANAVVLLVGFALPSAWAESLVWRFWLRARNDNRLVLRSAWVHLATVPVALLILLLPERPYLGLESVVAWQRSRALRKLGSSASAFVSTNGQVPKETDVRALSLLLESYGENSFGENTYGESGSDYSHALFSPRYSRLSTGETWQSPMEINPAVAGKRVVNGDEGTGDNWIWWVRSTADTLQRPIGLIVNTTTGEVRVTNNPESLGYARFFPP